MGLLCTHITKNGECNNEIEGMYDPYCLKHMNQYLCKKCKHTMDNHENKKTQQQEHCHRKDCKCKQYTGDLTD